MESQTELKAKNRQTSDNLLTAEVENLRRTNEGLRMTVSGSRTEIEALKETTTALTAEKEKWMLTNIVLENQMGNIRKELDDGCQRCHCLIM